MAGHETQRFELKPTVTSTDSLGFWVSLCIYGVALGLFLWFAESLTAWVVGSVIAVAWGLLAIRDALKWNRGRVLRRSLGALRLSVDSRPLRVGAEFHVWGSHEVKSRIHITASTLRLHCDTARIETYGIQERERKIWENVTTTEIFALRDRIVEAGSAIMMDARGAIPEGSLCTGDRRRWWLALETCITGMPGYSAEFAIEVSQGV